MVSMRNGEKQASFLNAFLTSSMSIPMNSEFTEGHDNSILF